LHWQRARAWDSATHTASRHRTDRARTGMLKDLGTKVLTRGAKGTVEDPGTHIKAKSRLNRVLPAGD